MRTEFSIADGIVTYMTQVANILAKLISKIMAMGMFQDMDIKQQHPVILAVLIFQRII